MIQPTSEANTFGTPTQILHDDPLQIARDHSARPLGKKEYARVWRHASLPDVEVFHGSYRKYGFARHYHSVPAIGVVDRGVMTSYCREANHLVPAGSVILLNAGEVHAPSTGGGNGWGFRTLYFDLSPNSRWARALGVSDFCFSKPFVEDAFLASCVLRLHGALEQSGTSLEFESALTRILARVADRHVCRRVAREPIRKEHSCVRRTKEYIEAHYQQDLTLDTLAGVAGLSPYHLLRTFRNIVGLTPHAYLIQARIEVAKRLLLSGASIATAATCTGFVDQSHFSRHFKRIVGTPPGQYHPKLRRKLA